MLKSDILSGNAGNAQQCTPISAASRPGKGLPGATMRRAAIARARRSLVPQEFLRAGPGIGKCLREQTPRLVQQLAIAIDLGLRQRTPQLGDALVRHLGVAEVQLGQIGQAGQDRNGGVGDFRPLEI